MSPTPYIEIYEFRNSECPAYPPKMWQVIEKTSLGEIINARAVPNKQEAEQLKFKFQQK